MIYILFTCFIILIIILKLPTVKGFIGEKAAQMILNKLNRLEYHTLNDLLVPDPNGKTTQIDHVVVSKYGIFVIETKNYTGWITGTENSPYWTQTIYKRKEKLYNPLWQNKGHVNALKALLPEFENARYIPIVAFSGRATLKVNVNSEVIYLSNLNKTIRKYKQPVLTHSDVISIIKKLSNNNLQDKTTRKEHVKTLQNENHNRNQKIRHNVCPSCNGKLVERSGKYGKFTGCSNYPKCKFILKDRVAR